jgi:hypothetical protein
MSISFNRGPSILIHEIKRAGYRIIDITSDISDPSRSVQIWLKNGVVVNWDRESHRVWANGPERLSEKIEAYIASQRNKRKHRKSSSVVSGFAMLILVGGLLLALVWEGIAGQHATRSTPPPPAEYNSDLP